MLKCRSRTDESLGSSLAVNCVRRSSGIADLDPADESRPGAILALVRGLHQISPAALHCDCSWDSSAMEDNCFDEASRVRCCAASCGAFRPGSEAHASS